MKLIETLCWLALALIHALPALAFVTPRLITRLYGAEPGSQVFLLMQHRAALFCAVFAACLWAAFDAGPRPLAALIAAISMLSFVGLWYAAGRPPALGSIARVDLIALPALVFVIIRLLINRGLLP